MQQRSIDTYLNVGARSTRKTSPVADENLTYSNTWLRSRSKKQVPSKLSQSIATAASPSSLTRNTCLRDESNAFTYELLDYA